MSEEFIYSSSREAYVFEGPGTEGRFRVVVPKEMVDQEAGHHLSEDERLTWLRDHLPQILQAYTARVGGGRVKEPWDRVLVEELD